LKLLLEKGTEFEAKDKCDQSPLLCASRNGDEVIVKLLLENGAELEFKINIVSSLYRWLSGMDTRW
jgi:ankyrin repeat protein